jgi:two-component system response regulator FixJ
MAEAPLVHIVDDDASVRDSLVVLLESAGFTVQAYDSAVAFLQAVSDRTAGCVLTDVQMPELNGLELQRRMGKLGIRLPVIVMTGHGDVPIAVEAMKAGAADFLEKPFDDEQLLTAISGAIAAGARRGRGRGRHHEAPCDADPARARSAGPPGGRSAE